MTTIPGVDNDLSAMMHSVLAKRAPGPEAGLLADVEQSFDSDLWTELSQLGLTRLTGSAASGGSEASWLEAAELMSAAASTGIHLPLAEHDLLAGALLEEASLPVDDRIRTVAELDADGVARAVPWVGDAGRVVLLWPAGGEWRIADADPAQLASVVPGHNLVGEPRDRVLVDLAVLDGTSIDLSLVVRYRLKGALVRAIQVCAALDRAMALSVEHVSTRTQFGRALGRFQAVQGLVADMAAECALARAATEAALAAAVRCEWSGDGLGTRIAVARSCAGHAATTVVRNAHQVHGAIGTAREHELHRFTRAALSWRGEFGSVASWDRRLADEAAAAGADGLWPMLAD